MTFPAVQDKSAETSSNGSIQPSGIGNSGAEPTSGKTSQPSWLLGGCCFIVAVGAALAQNLTEQNARIAAAFDSGHYLASTQLLVAWWWAYVSHLSAAQVYIAHHLHVSQLPSYLLIDGPLLPIAGAIVFSILGKVPAAGDWQTFVAMESFFHGLGAVLVFQLCRRLCQDLRLSAAAGICWALYPPAILYSGCYLTELPAVACELGYLLSLSWAAERVEKQEDALIKDRHAVFAALAAGLCAALLITTKPALSIAMASAAIPLFVIKARRALAAVCLALSAAMIIIVPWAAFSYASTGTVHLCAQRMPVLNAAKGGDLLADGVSTNPSTPSTAAFSEKDSVLLPLLKPWSEDPLAAANLMLRKPERLWSSAWNDFRFTCLKVSPAVIVWWHRIIVAFGMVAIVSLAWRKFRPGQGAVFVAGWGSVLIISGHLVYCIFETLPRYGFTAMPFLLVLGAAAVAFARQQRRLALFLAALGATILTQVLLFVNCLPIVLVFLNTINNAYIIEFALRATLIVLTALVVCRAVRPVARNDRAPFTGIVLCGGIAAILLGSLFAHFNTAVEPNEWRCTLAPGCAAIRNIDLSSNMQLKAQSPDWAMVLVDGDRNVENAQVRVNGHDLPGRLESVYKFDDVCYYQLDHLRILANMQRKDTASLRQWRAIQVPVAWLRLDGNNHISVTANGSERVTVYGAYPPPFSHKQPFLSLKYCSFGNLIRDNSRLDSRIVDATLDTQGQRSVYSRQKHFDVKDLSPSPGRQAGEYRINLVLGFIPGEKAENQLGNDRLAVAADADTAPVELPVEPGRFGQADSSILSVTGTAANGSVALPVLSAKGQTHLELSLLGDAWSTTGAPGSIIAMLTVKGSLPDQTPASGELAIPDTPAAVACATVSQPFAIKCQVPLVALPPEKKQLRINLSGTGCCVKDLRVLVRTQRLPSFANHTISIN